MQDRLRMQRQGAALDIVHAPAPQPPQPFALPPWFMEADDGQDGNLAFPDDADLPDATVFPGDGQERHIVDQAEPAWDEIHALR